MTGAARAEASTAGVATIVRVVHLTIEPALQPAFRTLFDGHRAAIRAAPGCLDVRLLTDAERRDRLITFSLWTSEAALDAYREGRVFRAVWPKARRLFAAPPRAVSHRITSRG